MDSAKLRTVRHFMSRALPRQNSDTGSCFADRTAKFHNRASRGPAHDESHSIAVRLRVDWIAKRSYTTAPLIAACY